MARKSPRSAGGSKRKPPRPKVKPGEETQATVDEFQREGMGVAAKE
jgi:hypothetical protein